VSGMALVQEPPRLMVILLALGMEAGILAALAACFQTTPSVRPVVATLPMAVQLVSWPEPTAEVTPERKSIAMAARSVPQKMLQAEKKPLQPSRRQSQAPIPPLAPIPGAMAVPSAALAKTPPPSQGSVQQASPAPIPRPPAPATRLQVRPSIPAYAHNPAPAYPEAARWAGEEGTVVLRVLVGADGRPEQIQVLRSAGSESLNHAAEKAVRHWRFNPGTRDGEPQAMWVEIPIRFRLQDAEK